MLISRSILKQKQENLKIKRKRLVDFELFDFFPNFSQLADRLSNV